MKRVIALIGKVTGNHIYACDGSGCASCSLRFKCFTASTDSIAQVDWSIITTKDSPTVFLRRVTGSKIYVKGSKRFNKIVQELNLPEWFGVVAQQAEVTG